MYNVISNHWLHISGSNSQRLRDDMNTYNIFTSNIFLWIQVSFVSCQESRCHSSYWSINGGMVVNNTHINIQFMTEATSMLGASLISLQYILRHIKFLLNNLFLKNLEMWCNVSQWFIQHFPKIWHLSRTILLVLAKYSDLCKENTRRI